jgi:hypothetical protein
MQATYKLKRPIFKFTNQIMRFTISVLFFLLICSLAKGQMIHSETVTDGVKIQNSLPRGGPYTGSIKKYFNVSNLIFFNRVINGTENPLELIINFSADSIAIPNSPDTFVKLFLPSDSMTLEKRNLFSYGVTELESFDQSTSFQRKLNPNEDCLLNVVAIFYQTRATEGNQYRGGNRAELVLKGQDLFYSMLPQIDSLHCGHIIFNK